MKASSGFLQIVKAFLLLSFSTTPANAWTFTPGTICQLDHQEADLSVRLTYDPAAPLYTISITQSAPLPKAPTFAIRFDGPQPIQIATDRHSYSADGTTLTVADQGFGNVLNGLQFNDTMTALSGSNAFTLSLKGAAAPTAAFRACEGPAPSV